MPDHAASKVWNVSIGRRKFLVGVASLSAATGLPTALWAQAAPSMFKQGDFEVAVVSDGFLTFPATAIAPDAPVEELKALLQASGILDGENAHPQANAVIIKTGSDIILFDTGAGAGFQPTAGKLPDSLAAAGLKAEDITKVVFTHGHLDHLGGTAVDGGKPRYPDAMHYVNAAEWDFWMDPALLSKMPAEMQGFVTGAQQNWTAIKDKVTMLKPGDDVIAGLRLLDTPGHTPGHASIEVAGGEGLIIMGDVAVNPEVFFEHPEWKFAFDADPDLGVTTRKAVLDRAATDKIKLLGYHWPEPVGTVERKDQVYRFVAAS